MESSKADQESIAIYAIIFGIKTAAQIFFMNQGMLKNKIY